MLIVKILTLYILVQNIKHWNFSNIVKVSFFKTWQILLKFFENVNLSKIVKFVRNCQKLSNLSEIDKFVKNSKRHLRWMLYCGLSVWRMELEISARNTFVWKTYHFFAKELCRTFGSKMIVSSKSEIDQKQLPRILEPDKGTHNSVHFLL